MIFSTMEPTAQTLVEDVSTTCHSNKPYRAMALPTFLEQWAGATLGNDAPKRCRCRVEEPHVAAEPLNEYHLFKCFHFDSAFLYQGFQWPL